MADLEQLSKRLGVVMQELQKIYEAMTEPEPTDPEPPQQPEE